LDWVAHCASEIYPIVGISYVGHKLQLFALLTFLDEDRRKGSLAVNSRSGAKGWREVKNLESLINDDCGEASSNYGNRKGRGTVVVL
jgi:hypothetical protein